MLNIRSKLSAVLSPVLQAALPPAPVLPEAESDRLTFDVIGLSDTDAIWYYETRRWRGRD